mmetsp:Transcript_11226/g.16868  ORF Transcript_11226/g.16868 Transcript_11226/m.16868 type:complete len:244 (-) Transcript_11226:52-783(-)
MEVHVHSEKDGLGSEQLKLVEDIDVVVVPDVHAKAGVLAIFHVLLDLFVGSQILFPALLALGSLGRLCGLVLHVPVDNAANVLQVLDSKFAADSFDVANRVDLVFCMDDIVVLKSSHHVDDAIHRLDVRQEGISQTLALGSTLDESGNVHHVQEGLHLTLWLVLLHEPVEPLIWHECPGLRRVDGAKREIRSLGMVGLAQRVVESALADIRQTDQPDLQILRETTQEPRAWLLFLDLLFGRHD